MWYHIHYALCDDVSSYNAEITILIIMVTEKKHLSIPEYQQEFLDDLGFSPSKLLQNRIDELIEQLDWQTAEKVRAKRMRQN